MHLKTCSNSNLSLKLIKSASYEALFCFSIIFKLYLNIMSKKEPSLFLILSFLLSFASYGQSDLQLEEGNKYFEDQFYVGVSYNFLLERPQDVKLTSLSYGLKVGFIKDFPINIDRNIAIGVGLGYGVNSYYQNLKATEASDGTVSYTVIINTSDFIRNKVESHLVELPIEFRWRTSNSTSYNFWRIYGGVKLGYAFVNNSKFIDDNENITFANPDLVKFQYGLTMSIGYNSWNFNAYYALNSLYKDGIVTDQGKEVKMMPLRIGLIFYLL